MTVRTKDAAFDLFEIHRAEWLAAARKFLDDHAVGTRLTVDDVRASVPPPSDIDGRVMGTVFRGRQWKMVEYRASTRTECHRRPIAVFERVG